MLFGIRQEVSNISIFFDDNKEITKQQIKRNFTRNIANFLLDKIKPKEKKTDRDTIIYEIRGVVISEKAAYRFLDLLKDRGITRDFVIAEFKKLINEKEI